MADDFAMVDDELGDDEVSDESRDKARLTVARHATDAGDCAGLLVMLGLVEDKGRPRGCAECSGPLSATRSGEFCSAKCRDAATRAGR